MKNDLGQCDACGAMMPCLLTRGPTAAYPEGSFCHRCRGWREEECDECQFSEIGGRQVREAFIAAICDECGASPASAIIVAADARLAILLSATSSRAKEKAPSEA